MKIALFSDIHGKFLLPFKLVDLYQKTTGYSIDLILQCGDMGAFPDIKNLDKATLKHCKDNRDELGFHDDFIKVKPEIQILLDELNINMVCVRGNHEDHDFLNKLEQQSPNDPIFPIDAYKRVWVCNTNPFLECVLSIKENFFLFKAFFKWIAELSTIKITQNKEIILP